MVIAIIIDKDPNKPQKYQITKCLQKNDRTKEYYPELQKRLEAYTPPYRYYRNCVVPLEDYLLEIAAGGKDIGLSAILADYELTSRFERVSHENGLSAETVLRNFIKDYIVSGGHPEAVNNLWRRE